jgi:hypothetical protein
MTTSAIIITCATAPHAATALSSGRQPHDFRAYLLRCHILPAYLANPEINEVIVVGEFEEGDGYRYIHVDSVERNSVHDALRKRQVGTDNARGDWLIVQNDDHILDLRAHHVLDTYDADVISPARWTRLRGPVERLNGGENYGYAMGHCSLYRREALDAVQWEDLERAFTFDVEHSQRLLRAGFRIRHPQDLRAYDIEYGAQPWR